MPGKITELSPWNQFISYPEELDGNDKTSIKQIQNPHEKTKRIKKMPALLVLPDVLLKNILHFLSPKDRCSIGQVCKELKQLDDESNIHHLFFKLGMIGQGEVSDEIRYKLFPDDSRTRYALDYKFIIRLWKKEIEKAKSLERSLSPLDNLLSIKNIKENTNPNLTYVIQQFLLRSRLPFAASHLKDTKAPELQELFNETNTITNLINALKTDSHVNDVVYSIQQLIPLVERHRKIKLDLVRKDEELDIQALLIEAWQNLSADYITLKEHKAACLAFCCLCESLGVTLPAEILDNMKENAALNKLWEDKDFLITAMKSNNHALKLAASKLRKDKAFVLQAVSVNIYAITYALDKLNDDIDVIHTAMKRHTHAMQFLSPSRKCDKELILHYVKKDAGFLQFISSKLRNDKDFMLELIKINYYAYEYAVQSLQKNKEFALSAISTSDLPLNLLSKTLRYDKEIMQTAVEKNPLSLEFVSEKFQLENEELILSALEKNGLAFKFISKKLQRDPKFISAALHENPLSLEFVSKKLQRENLKHGYAALEKNGLALKFVPEALLQENPDLIFTALKQNPLALEFVPHELQLKNKEIIYFAVEKNGLALQFVPPEQQNDRLVINTALKQNPKAFQYVSELMQIDKNVRIVAGLDPDDSIHEDENCSIM